MTENAKNSTGDFPQPSSENLAVDTNRSKLSNRELWDMMSKGDRWTMKKHQEVFYTYGQLAWTVRAAYWHIALATDAEGNRFLSECDLDRVLPKWKQILNGERFKNQRYPAPAKTFREWLDAERRKADRLGKPWPEPSPPLASSVGQESSAVMSHPFPDGHAGHGRSSSSGIVHPPKVGETPLLRQTPTEVRDLKQMSAHAIQGSMVRPMAPTPQATNVAMSSGQVYGPYYVPQDMQAHYLEAQAAQPYPIEVQPLAGADWLTVPEDNLSTSYSQGQ